MTPATYDEVTEAYYRRHITLRAHTLGIPERQLAAHIEWTAAMAELRGDNQPEVA